VSRRKKGSNRRRKAVTVLAKAHQRVRRQRQDFHHKTALALVRANDVIYHEEVQVRNVVKNHHLAKSLADAGWSRFLAILSDKAACAGRSVIAVNPAFTSRGVLAAVVWSPRAYPSAGIRVQTAGRVCIGTTTPPRISSGSGRAVGEPWR
jgi:IS605 OrfB family transposase